ncbi:MAG: hypothetical protein NT154_32640, partial [Verrucomicrobia bacterium]|nr:hypothetical protein [Verrucomicrobiota bacterium]
MNAAENPNLTRTVPPADPAQLPPDIRRDIEVILPLATSGFLDHFLESFLAKAGRLFRLPWWLVHAALYALVAIVAAVWVDQRKFFPRGGSLTLCGILAAEFVFTTWMLVHIRQSRTLALLAVARLNSGHDRLTWLRTFFGPMHWGWVIRGRSRPANHSKPLRLRLPALTLLLVIAFYVDLLMWGVEPGRHEAWETCQAHLLGL